MKKVKYVAVFVLAVMSILKINALTIADYLGFINEKKPQSFNAYTDMTPGFIMLTSFGLDKMRSYGAANYKYSEQNINGKKQVIYSSVSSTSPYNDGNDAMMKLVIQLFPSAGNFNPQGTGSLEKLFNNKGIVIRLIACGIIMAYAAQQSSQNQEEIPILSDFRKTSKKDKQKQLKGWVNKYIIRDDNAGLSFDEHQKKVIFRVIFKFFRDIVNAISLERDLNNPTDKKEDMWKERPYWRGMTRNLLCAYAWQILSKDDLPMLYEEIARFMPVFPESSPYQKLLLEKINQLTTNAKVVFPWTPGQPLVQHSTVSVQRRSKKFEFQDCVETALRQFFLLVFCDASTDVLTVDFKRIPENLKPFFRQYSVYDLGNNGSEEIRSQWVQICSGLPDVQYDRDNFYELGSGWKNIIEVFCSLMKEYPNLPGANSIAAQQIQQINDGNITAQTPEDWIQVLNKLLCIRTDIPLQATVYDEHSIRISPKDEKLQVANNIRMIVYPRHAELNNLSKFEDCQRIKGQIDNEDTDEQSGMDIIKKFFLFDLTLLKRQPFGKIDFFKKFPVMEYYLRLKHNENLESVYLPFIESPVFSSYREGLSRLDLINSIIDETLLQQLVIKNQNNVMQLLQTMKDMAFFNPDINVKVIANMMRRALSCKKTLFTLMREPRLTEAKKINELENQVNRFCSEIFSQIFTRLDCQKLMTLFCVSELWMYHDWSLSDKAFLSDSLLKDMIPTLQCLTLQTKQQPCGQKISSDSNYWRFLISAIFILNWINFSDVFLKRNPNIREELNTFFQSLQDKRIYVECPYFHNLFYDKESIQKLLFLLKCCFVNIQNDFTKIIRFLIDENIKLPRYEFLLFMKRRLIKFLVKQQVPRILQNWDIFSKEEKMSLIDELSREASKPESMKESLTEAWISNEIATNEQITAKSSYAKWIIVGLITTCALYFSVKNIKKRIK